MWVWVGCGGTYCETVGRQIIYWGRGGVGYPLLSTVAQRLTDVRTMLKFRHWNTWFRYFMNLLFPFWKKILISRYIFYSMTLLSFFFFFLLFLAKGLVWFVLIMDAPYLRWSPFSWDSIDNCIYRELESKRIWSWGMRLYSIWHWKSGDE